MSESVQIPMSIIDRFGRTLDTLGRQFDTIRTKQERLHREGARGAAAAGRSFDSFRSKQLAAYTDGERGANRFARSFENASSRMVRSGGAVVGVGHAISREIRSVIGLTTRLGTVAAAAGAGGVALLIRQGFKLNADMVRYRVTLETMMKSQARANGMLRWMYRFTERTPFQITGMAEAVTQLEAFGLNAQRWLPVVGNLAAAFGGTDEKVQQAIRSISFLRSGRTGEAFESLTRLGISRQDFVQQGLQFNKSGSLIGDPENALDALEGIVNTRFPGLMDRISRTFTGTMSNLQDVGQNFLRDTTRGLFDAVAVDARSALNTLEEMRTDGRLAQFRDAIGGALVDGFSQAKRFFETEVIDVFQVRGLGGVFENLFDKAKGSAADFLGWFAQQMTRAMVGAVKLAFSDADILKAAGLWLTLRNAGAIAGYGIRRLPSIASGLARGTAAAVGSRGIAGVAGAASRGLGTRAIGASVGRSNTATRIPTRLGAPAAPTPSFNPFIPGTVYPETSVGGGIASEIATIAAASAAPSLLARGYGAARGFFDRGAARVFPNAARAAAGGGAYLGMEGAAAAGTAAGTAAPAIGAATVALYGIASAADSVVSAAKGEKPSSWNLAGQSGLAYRSYFTGEENPFASGPAHIARNREHVDARLGRLNPLVRAALVNQGPDEARRISGLISGRAQLKDDVTARGDEFMSLADSLANFRNMSNATIDEMAVRLTNQGSGLIGGFETLEDRIDRITNRSLPGLREEAERLAQRRAGIASTFDPRNPQDFAFNLEGVGRQSTRNLRSIYEEKIAREGLRFKVEQGRVAENRGFLSRYLSARANGDDTSELLRSLDDASYVRRSGKAGGLDLDRLVSVQQATGLNLSKVIQPLAIEELRNDLTQQFGRAKADSILRDVGTVETDSAVFERKIDELIEAYRDQAEKQAGELAEAGDGVAAKIVGAFEDGTSRAVEGIASQIGVTAARVAGDEVDRLVATIIKKINNAGRDRVAVQQEAGFGG